MSTLLTRLSSVSREVPSKYVKNVCIRVGSLMLVFQRPVGDVWVYSSHCGFLVLHTLVSCRVVKIVNGVLASEKTVFYYRKFVVFPEGPTEKF